VPHVFGWGFYHNLIVTDEVTEFLLGTDFMCANDCEWLVSKGCILIRGRSVPMVKCAHKANICCVIVRDYCSARRL